MKTSAYSLLLLALLAFASPALAEDPKPKPIPTDAEVLADLKELQKAIGPDKRNFIKEQLELTAEEEARFWPIYDEHQKALEALNHRRVENVLAYANVWNANHIEDVPADKLVKEAISIERAEADLLQGTYDKLRGKVAPVKLVRYLQIESRLRTYVRYLQAEQVPLAE